MLARTEEHRAFMRPKFPAAFDLFYAVFAGAVADVAERLAAGDDAHARSADGRTPLTFAVSSVGDLLKADLLFEAGARIDGWDDLGMQPIHWTTGSVFHDDVSCLAWRARPSVVKGNTDLAATRKGRCKPGLTIPSGRRRFAPQPHSDV
ncbi:MAG: hypothetical protein C0483_19930 [Pirellula sp.]|nr:hypothetical protein [Pirellula sp.]